MLKKTFLLFFIASGLGGATASAFEPPLFPLNEDAKRLEVRKNGCPFHNWNADQSLQNVSAIHHNHVSPAKTTDVPLDLLDHN